MHTDHSLLDGINSAVGLPERIKKLGQKAVAITDHGNVSASYKFFKACKVAGVQPIIGMEAYYCVTDRQLKEKDEDEKAYYHLILIALNNEGLHNLFKISSESYTSGFYFKPRIDDTLLAEYGAGICATTTCLGSRASFLIMNNRTAEAERLIHHHRSLFDNRFMIELQLHKDEEQQSVNQALLKMALKDDYPVILTNDCHYPSQCAKKYHEMALCMQTKTTFSDPKRFTFGELDVHVAHHDWMWQEAHQQGLPYDVISNTVSLAGMVDSDSYFMDRMNRYPTYDEIPEGLRSFELLEDKSKQGLFEKFGEIPPVEYRERLDYELKAIKRMGFADYMLIVAQFMNGAREEGILHGPGRGSAAGSLVSYALGITEVDPIQYGLIFERFLNEGRGARPLIFNKEQAIMADKYYLPF